MTIGADNEWQKNGDNGETQTRELPAVVNMSVVTVLNGIAIF
jgi:hypothetical protein